MKRKLMSFLILMMMLVSAVLGQKVIDLPENIDVPKGDLVSPFPIDNDLAIAPTLNKVYEIDLPDTKLKIAPDSFLVEDKKIMNYSKNNILDFKRNTDNVKFSFKYAGYVTIPNYLRREGNYIILSDDGVTKDYIFFNPIYEDRIREYTVDECIEYAEVLKEDESPECLKTEQKLVTEKYAFDRLVFTPKGKNMLVYFPIDNYDPTFGTTAITFTSADPTSYNRTGYTITPTFSVSGAGRGNSSFWNYPGNKLVAYWDFNVNKTNVYDISGNNRNLTKYLTTGRLPVYNNGRFIYNKTRYFVYNSTKIFSLNPPFSISLTFNSDSIQAYSQVIFYYKGTCFNTAQRGVDLYMDSSYKLFSRYCNGSISTSSTLISPVIAKTDYNIVLTYNGTVKKNYVNGVLVDSKTSPIGNLFLTSGGGTDNIELGDSTTGFNGTADNFFIFNRSLSGQEISELYNASKNNRPPRCLVGMPCNVAGTKLNFTVVSTGTDNTFATSTSRLTVDQLYTSSSPDLTGESCTLYLSNNTLDGLIVEVNYTKTTINAAEGTAINQAEGGLLNLSKQLPLLVTILMIGITLFVLRELVVKHDK